MGPLTRLYMRNRILHHLKFLDDNIFRLLDVPLSLREPFAERHGPHYRSRGTIRDETATARLSTMWRLLAQNQKLG